MTSHIKDLTDFINAGKEIYDDKIEIRKYAEAEYEKYLKRIEKEEEREEKKRKEEEEKEERSFQRELRLLDRKEKITENEIENNKTINQGNGGDSRSPKTPGFKFNPFNEKNCDLDTWFNMFESQCSMYGVKDKDRKSHMMSLFSGQCLEALLSLDPKTEYDDIKTALLRRFNLTKHDYRKKFFSMTPNKGETVIAYCQRLNICFDRWVKLSNIDNEFKSLRDLVLCHKFMDTCNPRVSSFLLEQDSNDLKEVEMTATRFLQAHNEEPLGKTLDMPYSSNNAKQVDNRASGQPDHRSRDLNRGNNNDQYDRRSASARGFNRRGGYGNQAYNRGGYGNQAYNRDNYDNQTYNRGNYENQTKYEMNPDIPKAPQMPGKVKPRHEKLAFSDIKCHNCGGIGHIRPACTSKPMHSACARMESWRKGPVLDLPESLYDTAEREQHIYPGLIEETGVMKEISVLRDTGSMIHAVHSGLVKPSQFTGRTQTLITFGGKEETFRLATITVDTPFLQGKVTAYVLEEYPDDYKYYDVLIGNGGTLDSPIAQNPSPRVVDRWQQNQVRRNVARHEKSTKTNGDLNQVQTPVPIHEGKVKPVLNNNVLKQNMMRPPQLTHEVDTVSQNNNTNPTGESVEEKLKYCNISQIHEEKNDNVNIKVYEAFTDIILPSLEQTETVDDETVNPKLTTDQRTEIQGILKGILSPKQTEYIEIDIQIINDEPITLKPDPLSFTADQTMKNEVQSALNARVVQPSTSPHSSPIVLIKKIVEKPSFYMMILCLFLMMLLSFINIDDITNFVLMMLLFFIKIDDIAWNILMTTNNKLFDILRTHNLPVCPKTTKVEITTTINLEHDVRNKFITLVSENVENIVILPDKIRWTDKFQQAVKDIKITINSPILALSDLSQTFYVQTDASGVRLGAALLQMNEGRLRPCLFLSRKLEERETRYSVIERECLGVIWAVQKLARYLLGQRFILQTDHKPLKFINSGKTMNARICRWALILQQFEFSIEYITGSSNAIADFMSRNI